MQDRSPKSTFGIDINEYTQGVDFNVLATTVDFLYLRSSGSGTGRFRVDRKFLEFARQAREVGIPVGAYHYAKPYYDLTTADNQCDDFINILQQAFGTRDYGDLLPVLDVEAPVEEKMRTDVLINWIDRFRKRFEKKTRRRLMLYTGLFFIELYDNFRVDGKYPLSNMPLWIAMYTNVPINPSVPPDIGGWTKWRIWQFSEGQEVGGVGNPVDANWGPDSIDLLTQPREVMGLEANKVGNSLKVTWDRNTDTDLLGYNIFANNYWIGTVDKIDTEFVIPISKLPIKSGNVRISIEAFDYDGETSKNRASVSVMI